MCLGRTPTVRGSIAPLSIALAIAISSGMTSRASAQVPNHPVITEVYTDPPGGNDGPIGRDPTNAHQEFIEIYLPTCAQLTGSGLNCDNLNLAIYSVEGDATSSGVELVNYRIDLPTYDLNSINGITAGARPRPANGVVVMGWADYAFPDLGVCDDVSNAPCSVAAQNCVSLERCIGTPTGLLGTPSTRVGLINGGILADGPFDFIAINGADFSAGDTTNFPVPAAISLIHRPSEANSGLVQNGSDAYLLVNRDDLNYVELYDDKDTANVGGNLANADPSLATGTVLGVTSLLDAVAGNDDKQFRIENQPLQVCGNTPSNCVDLQTVLPDTSPFGPLVPQIPEKDKTRITPTIGNGYARVFPDQPKTSEDATVCIPTFPCPDAFLDATTAYRLIRNDGPFFPSPGVVALTTSEPELSVASDIEQHFQVLSQTVGRPGLFSANTGGLAGIDISVSGGTSSNSAIATFSTGITATNVPGQAIAFPSVAVTPAAAAPHLGVATAIVTATATKTVGGAIVAAQPVTVTATIIDPTTGLDAGGQAFQATVFLAIQAVMDDPAVANEFLTTDVSAFLAAGPPVIAVETVGNGTALLNPLANIAVPGTVLARELPAPGEECTNWINPVGPIGRLDLFDTIVNSGEVQSGAASYDSSLAPGVNCGVVVNRVQARRFNNPDTLTFGGAFSPSELLFFADAQGVTGNVRSGLSNATTSRTFEMVIVETNLNDFDGSIGTGFSDDFGLVMEVAATEPESPIAVGEFVFLSFSGGLQGADIDMLVGQLGNVLLQLIYLDLDNLHDVLGIRTIEQIFVIDGSGTSEPDVIEVFSLNLSAAPGSFVTSATPAHGESLWRTNGNVARLTFDSNITAPAQGDVMIQELLPNGAFGNDVSNGFSFTIENDLVGNPRILKIVDTGPPNLAHGRWYAIRQIGAWFGVSPFELHYVVQVGDADNNGSVVNTDASVINAAVPSFSVSDDDRRDIDGDGTILNDDVGFMNGNIPSFVVPKPGGH